jgi:8-oxo-dGTP pyrophosphatase MutT (NUDIX family)
LTCTLESELRAIHELLTQDEPMERVERVSAAVAAVLREGPRGLEVLLIKRAERDGDPWSGDVALPGGRVEAVDTFYRDSARRETKEEVGIDLSRNARFLGYMSPLRTRRDGIWVVPSVFLAEGALRVVENVEVSSHKWVPLKELRIPGNRSEHRPYPDDLGRSFPSFDLDGYRVWGLTERILSAIAESIAKRTE